MRALPLHAWSTRRLRVSQGKKLIFNTVEIDFYHHGKLVFYHRGNWIYHRGKLIENWFLPPWKLVFYHCGNWWYEGWQTSMLYFSNALIIGRSRFLLMVFCSMRRWREEFRIQPHPTYLSTLKICRVELCTELFYAIIPIPCFYAFLLICYSYILLHFNVFYFYFLFLLA